MKRSHFLVSIVLVLFCQSTAWGGSHQKIDDSSIYEVMKYAAGSPIYSYSIKFSLILDNSGNFKTLWFQDQNIEYHADFLTTLPEFRGLNRRTIDDLAMKSKGRRLLLGTILAPHERDEISGRGPHYIEILGADPLEADMVRKVFDYVIARAGETLGKVLYAPAPEQKGYVEQNRPAFESAGVAVVDLNSTSTNSACYTHGWAVGQVKVINAAEFELAWQSGRISSSDILVMDAVPRELPPFAALIVSQPSSPSSHPALLAEMSGSPFIYLRNANQQKAWSDLEKSGEPIVLRTSFFSVNNCRFFYQPATRLQDKEIDSLIEMKSPEPVLVKHWIDAGLEPIPLSKIGLKDSLKVGAKAAAVAELTRWIPKTRYQMAWPYPLVHLRTLLS
ncbi:MAG: hypothetical protein IPK68_02860 [Bdellovibrionales bacterium]|nr:hypothetical protein [Bdellovibrionales bacterium]